MGFDAEHRRVLVAAGLTEEAVQELFSAAALERWRPVAADNFARARFIQQHHPCDVLLVGDDLLRADGWQGLAWLVGGDDPAVVFLSSPVAATISRAYRHGAHVWLPRDFTLACPPLLAAALNRAAECAATSRKLSRVCEQLTQCRRHVDRLVGLIWRSSPGAPQQPHWFPQRYMMERLQEEIARTQRHGIPLTVAVGEAQAPGEKPEEETNLAEIASARIARDKRACDVVGQYGLRGFLLLLVHTPKEGGVICCRRLHKTLQEGDGETPCGPPLRAYFGLASAVSDGSTAHGLLRCAEQNLETAKVRESEPVVAG